jgi:hypothetical protein
MRIHSKILYGVLVSIVGGVIMNGEMISKILLSLSEIAL